MPSRSRRTLLLAASALLIGGSAVQAQDTCKGDKLRVAVDIGHYKSAPGATSATGKKEYYFNARFATELVAAAKAEKSLDLFLIEPTGKDLGLVQRPRMAEARRANLFMSIHHDSVQTKYLKPWTHEGVQKFYTDEISGYSLFIPTTGSHRKSELKLGTLIGERLTGIGLKPSPHHAEQVKGEGRKLLDPAKGIYEGPFAVLVNSRLPAILVEIGVLPNKEEEAKLETPEFRRRFQAAIIDALKSYCSR